MSIDRYAVIETALCIGGNLHDGEVMMVRADEHDRELATLNKVGTGIGETLGRVTAERDDLHKRMTAAEQRNATMAVLLREVSESLWQEDDSGDLFERIDAALAYPTESGASE